MLTTSYPLWRGHYAGGFVHDIAARLAEGGHRVNVVAPHAEGARVLERVDDVHVRRFRYMWPSSLQTLAYGGGIPSNLRRHPIRSLIQALPFGASFLAASLRAAEGCDLIHAHFAPTTAVAALVSRVRRIPVVLTVHGSDLLGAPGKGVAATLGRWGALRADRVICVAEVLAHFLQQWGVEAQRLEVIPNGIDASFFTTIQTPRRAYRILNVGRLAPEKGIDILIRAMALVVRQVPDAVLTLVGDGPSKSELQSLAQRLGLTNSVVFAGPKPHDEIPQWLGTHDVFVQPALPDRLGVATLEAMAAGQAIIAPTTGVRSQIAVHQESAMLITQGDAEALADAIALLLGDESLRQRLGSNAKRAAESLDWPLIIDRTLQVYRSVLPESPMEMNHLDAGRIASGRP